MEVHKTAAAGVGGLLAMFTVERLNVYLGTLIALLTITHLCIQIVKSLRKKR
jgi:hypothetical protein